MKNSKKAQLAKRKKRIKHFKKKAESLRLKKLKSRGGEK